VTPQTVWTSPVILTLCLSLVALAVSVGALLWQITSWKRSGPRIRVASTVGYVAADLPLDLGFVAVEARNSGRMATEVEQFGWQLPDGRTLQSPYNVLGQLVQLPMQLAPGGKVSMHYEPADINRLLVEEAHSGEAVRPHVVTGHGRFEGDPIHLGKRLETLRKSSNEGS
jgi:hypothetical protein